MTLKQLRVNKGLSQVELGNQVGLKQTTISQYENAQESLRFLWQKNCRLP